MRIPLHTSSARRSCIPVVGLALIALAAIALAAPAAASNSTIGSLKFTGQVAGTVKLTRTETAKPYYVLTGCQLSGSEGQFLFNVPNSKLPISGKKTSVTTFVINVWATKYGNTETVSNTAGGGNGSAEISFTFSAGKKMYSWTATSGTISTKSKGLSGTFKAVLAPTSSLPDDNGDIEGGGPATKPVQLSATWTSCTPFPKMG
jgi:hypothetical protein